MQSCHGGECTVEEIGTHRSKAVMSHNVFEVNESCPI